MRWVYYSKHQGFVSQTQIKLSLGLLYNPEQGLICVWKEPIQVCVVFL